MMSNVLLVALVRGVGILWFGTFVCGIHEILLQSGEGVGIRLPSETGGCFPAIFSFGSSVADTGTGVLIRSDSPADNYPYGMTYFRTSSKRWGDGRLLIDLWAQALRLPFLDPFIRSVSSTFLQGANFASAACTARNDSIPGSFNLALQFHQFRNFKREVLAANSPKLPPESSFQEALYMIAVGANDLYYMFKDGMPGEEIKTRIPSISAAILHVVKGLYEEGARNILVEDVYPLGCMAATTTAIPLYGETALPDSTGCSNFFNDLVQMHNSLLKQQIAGLAHMYPDLSVAMVDTYSFRHDMITNPGKYGFKYGVQICCGGEGGKYNFDSDRLCGVSREARTCSNPAEYVVWDGLHFTEAANIVTLKALLSGKYFHPHFQVMRGCCTLGDFN